ncbi:MAG TPA: type III-B CRISPR module-associated protein Cmr5 [Phycisphaerales bacterium]|nr:type III-B CRISPR module-associated protein Cmr5 [Phycisphaerales bacterium]HMP38564.1 type III-B CRISPR module-associated protein Cmr5 [Phycisphaerales bacterium]
MAERAQAGSATAFKRPATRRQAMGMRAYQRVDTHLGTWKTAGDDEARKKYLTFARRFPSLIQSSGLAAALAFAHDKLREYLDDLSFVLEDAGGKDPGTAFAKRAREESELVAYLVLSTRAIEAASWLKRYAEALLDSDGDGASGGAKRSGAEKSKDHTQPVARKGDPSGSTHRPAGDRS